MQVMTITAHGTPTWGAPCCPSMEYYLISFAKQDECTAAVRVSADIEVVQFGGFTCWYNIQHK